MKMYRVQFRAYYSDDMQVHWCKTKKEARTLLNHVGREWLTEAINGYVKIFIPPDHEEAMLYNNDVVYRKSDEKWDDIGDFIECHGWGVEEVNVPTTKDKMVFFLNYMANQT
jgi:hypothetical protein